MDLLCDRIYHLGSCIRGNISSFCISRSSLESNDFNYQKAKHKSVHSAKDFKGNQGQIRRTDTSQLILSKRSTDIIQVAY